MAANRLKIPQPDHSRPKLYDSVNLQIDFPSMQSVALVPFVHPLPNSISCTSSRSRNDMDHFVRAFLFFLSAVVHFKIHRGS
jgi:hypothetical protein